MNNPPTDIPTIEIDAASPTLYTIKSKSFEIPRPRAHFDTLATRPDVSTQESQRPNIYSHRSLTQSVSSLSLYSHFAGERFSPKHSIETRSREIKRDNKADDSSETATSFSEEEEEPKASVSKAMFMFLKAFIGSGVLFLPKA